MMSHKNINEKDEKHLNTEYSYPSSTENFFKDISIISFDIVLFFKKISMRFFYGSFIIILSIYFLDSELWNFLLEHFKQNSDLTKVIDTPLRDVSKEAVPVPQDSPTWPKTKMCLAVIGTIVVVVVFIMVIKNNANAIPPAPAAVMPPANLPQANPTGAGATSFF